MQNLQVYSIEVLTRHIKKTVKTHAKYDQLQNNNDVILGMQV